MKARKSIVIILIAAIILIILMLSKEPASTIPALNPDALHTQIERPTKPN
jgi:hypothetical protein